MSEILLQYNYKMHGAYLFQSMTRGNREESFMTLFFFTIIKKIVTLVLGTSCVKAVL